MLEGCWIHWGEVLVQTFDIRLVDNIWGIPLVRTKNIVEVRDDVVNKMKRSRKRILESRCSQDTQMDQ